MRKLMIIILILSAGLSAQEIDYSQDYTSEPYELLTIYVDSNIMPTGKIRPGGGLNMQFNLPGNFTLGMTGYGGNILTDIKNYYYYSSNEYAEDSSFYRSELSDGEFGLHLGYELYPKKLINPYISAGIGFYFVTFRRDVPKAELVRNPATDSLYTRYFYTEENASSDLAGMIPLTIGVNSRFVDWLQASIYIRYIHYLDDLFLYGIENPEITPPEGDNGQLDINEKRGNLSIGIRLGIPIEIEM